MKNGRERQRQRERRVYGWGKRQQESETEGEIKGAVRELECERWGGRNGERENQ